MSLAIKRGPTGLVAGADAGAVVAVEVFVERHEIAPMRVVLKFLRAAENRPAARSHRAERYAYSRCEMSPATSQRFIILPEPVGTLDFVLVAVENDEIFAAIRSADN